MMGYATRQLHEITSGRCSLLSGVYFDNKAESFGDSEVMVSAI
jgi:hypothetical protein